MLIKNNSKNNNDAFKLLFIIIVNIFIFISAYSKNDTIIFDEIIIKSSRISLSEKQVLRPVEVIGISKIRYAFDNDISSSLNSGTSIDIRRRSFSKVQSDLSIRGGTFDQNIVLLNGINLSDPQTGHHNLNMPINNSDLQGIEIVYGPGARIFGANAFTGAVNFITKIPDKNFLKFDISAGSFNTFNTNISAGYKGENTTHYFSADYSQSDGFKYNTDYNRLSLYYENNTRINSVNVKTMAGFIDKSFGAYNFYTPQFPNQYEQIKSYFTALKIKGGENIKWTGNIYGRRLYDRFELFREDKNYYIRKNELWINQNTADTVSWYKGHNYHLTNIAGSGFNAETDWVFGKSAIGMDYRLEHIFSNVLGNELDKAHKNLYSKSDTRQNISLFAEHGYYTDKFISNIGAMAYWNRQYDWNFYYGGDAGYYLNKNILVKAGINKAIRLPTFTELYYESLSNLGNPDLIPEHAITYEIGGKYTNNQKLGAGINFFYREGENIISWVKQKGETKWKTENLTTLNTTGIETNFYYAGFNNAFILNKIHLSYMFMEQGKYTTGLESKYTLDQLRHKLILNIDHNIYKKIKGFVSLNIFKRNGEFEFFDTETMTFTDFVKYPVVYLINYSINYQLNNIDFYIRTYNITNQDYFDIGNVPTPGFSFLVGIKYNFLKST